MTMILILAVALAVGVSIQSRWAMVLPVAVGIVAALAVALTGNDLSDTPIPFLVVICTLAIAGARVARSRLISSV
jgi:hypothetical protein